MAEAVLQEQFPPLGLSLSNPSVIDDASGHVALYYLPDALLPHRQVCTHAVIHSIPQAHSSLSLRLKPA